MTAPFVAPAKGHQPAAAVKVPSEVTVSNEHDVEGRKDAHIDLCLDEDVGSPGLATGLGGYTFEYDCLLYTSPSPRDQRGSRMPSSA